MTSPGWNPSSSASDLTLEQWLWPNIRVSLSGSMQCRRLIDLGFMYLLCYLLVPEFACIHWVQWMARYSSPFWCDMVGHVVFSSRITSTRHTHTHSANVPGATRSIYARTGKHMNSGLVNLNTEIVTKTPLLFALFVLEWSTRIPGVYWMNEFCWRLDCKRKNAVQWTEFTRVLWNLICCACFVYPPPTTVHNNRKYEIGLGFHNGN